MNANDIEKLIKAGIPDAEVTIRDLAGDGDHYAATVIAESFRTRIIDSATNRFKPGAHESRKAVHQHLVGARRLHVYHRLEKLKPSRQFLLEVR